MYVLSVYLYGRCVVQKMGCTPLYCIALRCTVRGICRVVMMCGARGRCWGFLLNAYVACVFLFKCILEKLVHMRESVREWRKGGKWMPDRLVIPMVSWRRESSWGDLHGSICPIFMLSKFFSFLLQMIPCARFRGGNWS